MSWARYMCPRQSMCLWQGLCVLGKVYVFLSRILRSWQGTYILGRVCVRGRACVSLARYVSLAECMCPWQDICVCGTASTSLGGYVSSRQDVCSWQGLCVLGRVYASLAELVSLVGMCRYQCMQSYQGLRVPDRACIHGRALVSFAGHTCPWQGVCVRGRVYVSVAVTYLWKGLSICKAVPVTGNVYMCS